MRARRLLRVRAIIAPKSCFWCREEVGRLQPSKPCSIRMAAEAALRRLAVCGRPEASQRVCLLPTPRLSRMGARRVRYSIYRQPHAKIFRSFVERTIERQEVQVVFPAADQ